MNNQYQKSFTDYLTTWGYLDINTADEKLREYDIDPQELAERLEEFAEEIGVHVYDLDPVQHVYEIILQNVREEIEDRTGKDIHDSKDNDNNWLEVSPNFMCTSFDGSEEAYNFVKGLIEQIPEKDRSYLLQTFYTNEIINR